MERPVVDRGGSIKTVQSHLGDLGNVSRADRTVKHVGGQFPDYCIRQAAGIVRGGFAVSTALIQAQEELIA